MSFFFFLLVLWPGICVEVVRYCSFSTVTTKGLFTWSGGPLTSGVGFFCFHALGETKQKKLSPLDRGPPLHVHRV